MTDDLEMTKLCAQAMGLRIDQRWPKRPVAVLPNKTNYRGRYRYDPLHDDAQAMALLKRFKLNIGQLSDGRFCKVFVMQPYSEAESTDLNRAIVECVAKM